MPHLNRIFKVLGIHHEEHKVPAKVLRSIEDKERKATTAKVTTAQAESKKRKAAGKSKTTTKRRKVVAAPKASSTDSDEEEAGVGAIEPTASDSGGGDELMSSVVQGLTGGAAIGAPDLDPLPSVFGASAGLSSSKDEDGDAGMMAESDDDEATSKGQTRSLKAFRQEESNMELEDRLLTPGSPQHKDAAIANAARGILSLG